MAVLKSETLGSTLRVSEAKNKNNDSNNEKIKLIDQYLIKHFSLFEIITVQNILHV